MTRTGATALSAAALGSLPAGVTVPGYDRRRVRAGIVHLGVGGFHRAHQAVYVDRLLGDGALDWGICGVGVLPADRRMRDVLERQDGLYTVVVKRPDGSLDAAVVGSLVEYLLAPEDPEAVVERMADERIRIVSLTITEGGYLVDPATGEFAATEPSVRADLRPGAVPRTVFGLVTAALARRRERGVAPFTVVSCDNLPGNGGIARAAFGGFTELRDPGLGQWVRERVCFPSSMVDRITPATTDEDRAELARRFGVADGWPVVCEPFTQWVLEDAFCCGRPRFEDAGVQVVADVGQYELMKLRLLNAGHQVLAHLGRLAGHDFVHQACQDPPFRRLLEGYLTAEGAPTLAPVPGIDLPRYMDDVVERFAGPAVRDTLDRIRADASDRIPKFLLPVLRANLAGGGEIGRTVAVLAGWARCLEGTDDDGRPLEVVDGRSDRLLVAAARQGTDPLALLRDRELFGDLADDPRVAEPYRATLDSLRRRGARATVESLVRGSTPG